MRVRTDPRTLVTASGSDTPRPSCLLCHGLGCTSSWSRSPLLRRCGHAPSPENLPSLSAPLRDLRVVRSRPCVLLVRVSHRWPSAIDHGRPATASSESGRSHRSSRSSACVSRAREGSDFPRAGAVRHTPRRHVDGSWADRTPGGCVALCGLWPRERVAPSTRLAHPSRVPKGRR